MTCVDAASRHTQEPRGLVVRARSVIPARVGPLVRCTAPSALAATPMVVVLEHSPMRPGPELPLVLKVCLLGVAVTAGVTFAGRRGTGGGARPSQDPGTVRPTAEYLLSVDTLIQALHRVMGADHVPAAGRRYVSLEELVAAARLQGIWSSSDARQWVEALTLRQEILERADQVCPTRIAHLQAELCRLASLVTSTPPGASGIGGRRTRLSAIPEHFSMDWLDGAERTQGSRRLRVVNGG